MIWVRIEEVNFLLEHSGFYFINIINIEENQYIEVPYCSENLEDDYMSVQENFESLPLYRLNISKVEVYPSCGVSPRGMWDEWLQFRKEWFRSGKEQATLGARASGAKSEDATGRVLLKAEDCMIYEHLRSEFTSTVIDVKFKCLDISEVRIFTAQSSLYDFDVENRKGDLYLYASYCQNGREGITEVRENFELLPLHRLNVSRVRVYEGCGTIPRWVRDEWFQFLEK